MGWISRLLSALTLLLLVSSCHNFKVYQLDRLDFPQSRFRLDNGMRVIVQPDPGQQDVTAVLHMNIGLKNDPRMRHGLAHVVEHLFFRYQNFGTDQTFMTSEPNADINADDTVYYTITAPRNLPFILNDWAAKLQDFSQWLTEKDVATEVSIVRNERRFRRGGTANEKYIRDLKTHLHAPSHPYYQSDGGTHEELSLIEFADVKKFIQEYYQPSNATLVIVGPVRESGVVALVEESFSGLKSTSATQVFLSTPESAKKRINEDLPRARSNLLTLSFVLPPKRTAAAQAVALMDQKYGGWLWYELVRRRGLALSVYSFVEEQALESRYMIKVSFEDLRDQKEIEEIIFENIDKDWPKWTKRKSHQRQQRLMMNNLIFESENPLRRARKMADYYTTDRRRGGWHQELASLLNQDAKGIKALFKKFVGKDKATIILHRAGRRDRLKPVRRSPAQNDASGSGNNPKASGGNNETLYHHAKLNSKSNYGTSLREFESWSQRGARRLNSFSEHTLSNGILCRITQRPGLPLMSAVYSVPLRRQDIQNPLLELGVALSEPDSSSVRELRYSMGQRFGAWTHQLRAYRSSRSLSQNADGALYSFAAGSLDSRVSVGEFDRVRAEWLEDLSGKDRTNADLLTSYAFDAHRFGGAHTWTVQELLGLDEDDLEDAIETTFRHEQGVLSIVSDRSASKILPLAEEHFGSYQSWGTPQPKSTAFHLAPADGTIIVVPSDDTEQTNFSIYFDLPKESSPLERYLDRNLPKLLKLAAGDLREELGTTYGVQAKIVSMGGRRFLKLSTLVQRDAVDEALNYLLQSVYAVRRLELKHSHLESMKRRMISDAVDGLNTNLRLAQRHNLLAAQHAPRLKTSDDIREIYELTLPKAQTHLRSRLSKKGILVIAGKIPKIPRARDGILQSFDGKIINYSVNALLGEALP